jgi:catechol-2,3-dioxygenase
MPTRIRGITEIVLNVHELGTALAFYRDILGLTVISPPTMQDRVYLEAGGAPTGVPQMIVLQPLGPESSSFASPRQLHHLALEISSSDFDAELERLKGLGYRARVGRHAVVPAKTMYLVDPDGNEVALICKK